MSFAQDLCRALRERPKKISPKHFYDERGAALFEQICRLEAYYLTAAELSILRQHAPAIARSMGRGVDVIELGSGAAVKTRLLLSALEGVSTYIPIDLARDQLAGTAARLRREYPRLRVEPVCADFTGELELPAREAQRSLVFFPGSTIGNFEPHAAIGLMRNIVSLCGACGGALVGIDLKKDPAVLHRAYNDDGGVTAAFNLNLLARANRELAADFSLGAFRHYAYYDPRASRIEMTLVSLSRQQVRIGDERFDFSTGEPITTEYSYKYELSEFAGLAAEAGLAAREAWLDPSRYFALVYLTPR